MSVQLMPIHKMEDGCLSFTNSTWMTLTKLTAGKVAQWNGKHDPITYTPEELRAIAAIVPSDCAHFNWVEGLNRLADLGGAELY